MAAPEVKVKQGWLRGTTVKSVDGGTYVSFRGIPYAAPPVGKLRFADPSPPASWTGFRDASKFGSVSLQFDAVQKKIIGDEDSLFLNVATSSLDGPRPVMVWIHGGGFFMGSGNDDLFGPDYLVEQGVVFVSINYRLGVFGFLQLHDPAASGNMGLKDQTAALKWVKENISQFGGDPNNITIFGASAGGASVHYQLLSPLSKGLFNKAIMQSGTALDTWASMSESQSAEHLSRYLAALGKESSDPKEIVEFLRTIPAENLMQTQLDITRPEDLLWVELPFMPSVDDKSKEPFMPRHPKEIGLEGSEVPFIIGCTTHEGIVLVSDMNNSPCTALDENSKLILPNSLVPRNHPKKDIVSDEVRKFYFGDEPITEDSIDNWIQTTGDICFTFGLHKVVETQQKTKKAPCYIYKLSYDTTQSLGKCLSNSSYEGVAHGDEIPYLFNVQITGDRLVHKPGTQEKIVSDRMVKLWTNFAKHGNPTPETNDLINVKWLPVTENEKHYLNIDGELSAGIDPDEKVVQLSHRISEILDDE
ncbi:esterase FE4-like isoform X2 [Athalia rosae]|uniref:esterase FE4-like isoform X2 n=1 Tax=Athalia rosae TaxID=37344 RepID=UPI002033D69D|nr:esterase FE4-like isoform X2 [Athalia rosae]